MISREEIREALTGPVTSICTPFNQDGSLDFASLRTCIDFYLEAGSKAIILTYGDSLYSILSDQEVADVTKVVVEHTRGRAMVVAADRMWATPQTIEFARYVREIGADVLMVLPPDWTLSCTVESFVEHYAAIAEHIPVMIVTNLFARRPVAQSLRVLERVRDQVEGVVAIKDDLTGEFARKMCLLVHDHWAIISGGRKQNHLDLLPYGCDGFFSTFSKFKPQVTHAYWQAVLDEDWLQVREIISRYDMPLFDFITSLPGGFDAGIHGILELFGLAQRWRRKPYYSLNDVEMAQLADFFKAQGWR